MRGGTEAGVVSEYRHRGTMRRRRRVTLKRRNYFAHRLVWAMTHGVSDPPPLDHINGDPMDNRIENLRAVTLEENSKNAKTPRDNRSGRIGVCRHRRGGWDAYISLGKKQIKLGRFRDIEDAIAAREKAEKDPTARYHVNHGRM